MLVDCGDLKRASTNVAQGEQPSLGEGVLFRDGGSWARGTVVSTAATGVALVRYIYITSPLPNSLHGYI